MIGCVRARALSHARIRRAPLVRPLPISWIGRFASTNDSSQNKHSASTSDAASAGAAGPRPPSESHSYPDCDPPPAAPPIESSGDGMEPWVMAQDFVSDNVGPLMSDAAFLLLTGVVKTGGLVMGAVQAGVEGVHDATGLPWWATIAVVTIGVKVSLLPVVVHQQRHIDRMRMAWPEIQTLRGHLADTLKEIPQQRLLKRSGKYRVFFSGVRGIMGLHGARPLGLLATPLVNLPVFIMFVWSIRSMLRDATVPGLDTGGMLWFVDLTVSDSSLMLPVIGTVCTYTGLELAKMKGATGWIKFFQEGMQTFIILMLPWISTFPQGVFMYWIPSSVFQSTQTLAMKNDHIRGLFGLQKLRSPPPPPAAAPPAQAKLDDGSSGGKVVLPPGEHSRRKSQPASDTAISPQ